MCAGLWSTSKYNKAKNKNNSIGQIFFPIGQTRRNFKFRRWIGQIININIFILSIQNKKQSTKLEK